MVLKWRKQDDLHQENKTEKSFQENKARWLKLEDKTEHWVIEQRTAGRSISTVSIRLKATVLGHEISRSFLMK